jgi:hypothetical protein
MYNKDTELLFPSRIIQALADQRGEEWRKLVEKVDSLPQNDQEHLAFVLLMTRVNNCNTCNSDSFRAMKGCTECALQNVRRFRGSDKELIKQYQIAIKDLGKSSKHK